MIYTPFIQYCRICGTDMLAEADGASELAYGKTRDSLCSDACAKEFAQRVWDSLSAKEQDLQKQRSWNIHTKSTACGK